MRELLGDSASTAYLGVALATDMAVTEALELQDALEQQLSLPLEAVIVNGLLPRRFTAEELDRITKLTAHSKQDEKLTQSAARAAKAVHERSRLQHNQVARLRRRSFEVIGVPFAWGPRLDLEAVRGISARLSHKL